MNQALLDNLSGRLVRLHIVVCGSCQYYQYIFYPGSKTQAVEKDLRAYGWKQIEDKWICPKCGG